jgi:hypothetical protein
MRHGLPAPGPGAPALVAAAARRVRVVRLLMPNWIAAGEPYPQADEKGLTGFRLGTHAEYYQPPFSSEPPVLFLRYTIDADTQERFVRWVAIKSSLDQSDSEDRLEGYFPFARTGLPWPSRT